MGYLGIALLVLMIWHGMMNASGSRSIPYSEFKKHVDRGEVVECSNLSRGCSVEDIVNTIAATAVQAG